MSRLLGFGSAFPDYELSPEAGRVALSRVWPHLAGVAVEPVTRRLVLPIEEVLRGRGLSQSMELYRREATQLGTRAARSALADGGIAVAEIDGLIAVSCTGYMVPGLDVTIAQRLGLRPDAIRICLTEHGCAGGGAALALAHRLAQSQQVRALLVVCVEICSLTFRADDDSVDNLAASLVFGDGAAAAVVADRPGGLQLVRAATRLIPDSQGALGFDLRDDGFHPVLDRRLPQLLERELGAAVAAFGAAPGILLAVHAGGPRIFDAVESALGLEPSALEPSREAFRRHGNLSSGSLLLVLAELPRGYGRGLSLAFGPGVTVELAELRRCPE